MKIKELVDWSTLSDDQKKPYQEKVYKLLDIIESVDMEKAPLRMVLGSQALSATIERLKERGGYDEIRLWLEKIKSYINILSLSFNDDRMYNE